MDDGQIAEDLLHRIRDHLWIVAHQSKLIGMLQEQQGAQPDRVRCRLVAGNQQDVADTEQLLVGQFIGMIADQHAEDVVARVLPVPIHQRLHVGVHLARVLGLLLTRHENVQHRVAAPLELWLIFERHAE